MTKTALWLIVLDGKRGLFRLVPIAHGADAAGLMQRVHADICRLPCLEPEGLPECLKETYGSAPAPPAAEPDVYVLALRHTKAEAQALAAQFREALPDPRTPLPPYSDARLQAVALGIPYPSL